MNNKDRALTLIDELKDRGAINNKEVGTLRRAILLNEQTPTVVAENATSERPTGKWIKAVEPYYHICSNCKMEMLETAFDDFCPNCGADMRGGKE